MALYLIAFGFMGLTLMAKWFSVKSLINKQSDLTEAKELKGQAKFRLNVAVKEVTNAQAEIDKYKRKVKNTSRKIDRLKDDYKKHSQKSKETEELNAEKLRLAKELKKSRVQA